MGKMSKCWNVENDVQKIFGGKLCLLFLVFLPDHVVENAGHDDEDDDADDDPERGPRLPAGAAVAAHDGRGGVGGGGGGTAEWGPARGHGRRRLGFLDWRLHGRLPSCRFWVRF